VSVVELARELAAEPVGIERTQLQRVLREAAADTPIHLDSPVMGYQQHNGGVAAMIGDGRVVEGRALIGADGLRSAVRAQLLQDGDPTYTGATVWRGITDASAGAAAGSVFMTLGPRGVRGGAWFVGDRRVSWFVGINAPPGTHQTPDAMKPTLLARVSRFAGPIPGLVESTPAERIHQTDVYVRPPCDTWGDGRVTLLGDAAHAMGTVLGQGGAQALEDAVVLADSLAGSTDIVEGLRRYEQRRIPRARAVSEEVRDVGRFVGLQNPVLCWLRNLALPRMSPGRSLDRMRRVMTFAE
jgi:2-polyprenyl-6-methoxyphenol hydroxylase-like FAD-dependent oxidoreductase